MRLQAATLSLVVASFAVAGQTAPPPVPFGPALRLNRAAGSAGDPSIAAFPDGGFVVVWSHGGLARARFLDRRGMPAGPDFRLAGARAGKVAADPDGSFLVAWATSTPSSPASSIFVRRYHRDGKAQGERIRVSRNSRRDRWDPVIAIGPDGRFAVAWRAEVAVPDLEDVFYTNAVARIITREGAPLTPEITLFEGDPPSPAGDDPFNAFPTSLALRPDGSLAAVVAIHELCFHEVLAQVSAAGTPLPLQGLGSPFCVHSEGRPSTALAMGRDGSLVATWSEYCALAQRFAPSGTPRGNAFSVGCGADSADPQSEPAVALQAGGSFTVVFTRGDFNGETRRDVFGHSFAANGTPRTPLFRVNRTTAGDQLEPAIAAPREGPVVVVWTQQREEHGPTDVFARVLRPR